MDFPILYVLGIFAFVALVFYAALRHTEIFRIHVEAGRPRVVRGAPPPGFVDDVRTIAKHLETAVIRAVKEGGEPRIVASSSVDDATLQRLRNAYSVRRRRA